MLIYYQQLASTITVGFSLNLRRLGSIESLSYLFVLTGLSQHIIEIGIELYGIIVFPAHLIQFTNHFVLIFLPFLYSSVRILRKPRSSYILEFPLCFCNRIQKQSSPFSTRSQKVFKKMIMPRRFGIHDAVLSFVYNKTLWQHNARMMMRHFFLFCRPRPIKSNPPSLKSMDHCDSFKINIVSENS